MRKHMILVLILLLPIVKADIISINSYGNGEIVLIPTSEIDGFFFGELPKEEEGFGGGGVPEIKISPEDIPFLCNYSYDFIKIHYFDNTINYTVIELEAFRENLLKDTGRRYGSYSLRKFFDNITINCQEFFKPEETKKKQIIIILLLIFVSVLTFLGVYLRKKVYYLGVLLSTKLR